MANRWWEQGGLDLEGAQETARLVEVEGQTEGLEDGDDTRD